MNRNIKAIVEEIVPKLNHLTEKQRSVIESALLLFSEKGITRRVQVISLKEQV